MKATFEGVSISTSFMQLSNAPFPMEVTSFGIIKLVRFEQFENVFASIMVRFSERIKVDKLSHDPKDSAPRVVTVLGNVILVRLVQAPNVPLPIVARF